METHLQKPDWHFLSSFRLVRRLCFPCEWFWVSTYRTVLSHKVSGSEGQWENTFWLCVDLQTQWQAKLIPFFSERSISCVWRVDARVVQRLLLITLSTFLHCRAYYGNINFFGGPSATSVKASAKLKQLEEENEDAMFVVVSDVWLDNIEVMEKLSLMFSGVCFLWVFTWPNTHKNPLTRWHASLSSRLRLHASNLFHLLWQLLICPLWKRTDSIPQR